MRNGLLTTTAIVMLGGALFTIVHARAQMQTIDVATGFLITAMQNAVTGMISSIGSQITGAVTGMQTSVNNMLRDGFTQNANYAKAAVGAHQGIADANNMVHARLSRDLRNVQIRDEHTANPQFCNAVDNAQTPIVASISSYNVAQAIQLVADRRGEAVPGTPGYYGQAQAVQAINRLHMTRYCSEVEAQAGLCTRSTYPNADQQATNLFGTGTYPGQDGVNAANDFRTNLLQPIVPAALRADQISSLTGQDAWARRRAYNARMSLAGSVLSYAIAVQTPSVPLTAQQQQQQRSEGLPAQTSGSWLTAISLEVNRRMSDAGWHASLQAMPPASVQREIAVQTALGNYLAMQNYRLGLYQASLTATQVAQTEERNFNEAVQMPTPSMASN